MNSTWNWPVFHIAVFALLALGLRVLIEGPTPPTSDFDLDRARTLVEDLVPENAPHPAGSADNLRIRNLIEERLQALGYAPQVQTGFPCSSPRSAGCTKIENVYAVKSSPTSTGDAILVTAHYDSVFGGPGAADDIAGVAVILEVARIVANEPYKNDIIFLLSDGEETGLRGASAFAEENPLMDKVKMVINLEARGASGPSAMFETGPQNYNLIKLFASAVSRPTANSLTYEVYRRMPNDTDMTVHKHHGATGLNFAATGHASLYHSILDDKDHLNPRVIAHHGNNVLDVLRITGNTSLDDINAKQDAVYFDLFGRMLVYWPAKLNIWLFAGAFILIIGVAIKTSAIDVKNALWSVGVLAATFIGLYVIGRALSFPLGIWPGASSVDHAFAWPGRLALLFGGLFLTQLIGAGIRRYANPQMMIYSAWGVIAILGLILSLTLPGAAYLALAPALVFAVAALIEHLAAPQKTRNIAAHIGFVAAAYMALYHFLILEAAVGFGNSEFRALALALSVMAGAPLAAIHMGNAGGRLSVLAASGAMIAASLVGMVVPPYAPDRPRAMNIVYQQTETKDGERESLWRLHSWGPDDKHVIKKAGLEPGAFYRYGVYKRDAHFKPAKDHRLPAPAITVIDDSRNGDERYIKAALTPGGPGLFWGLSFMKDTAVKHVRINDTIEMTGDAINRRRYGQQFIFHGSGQTPIPIEITAGNGPIEITLFEISGPPPQDEDGTALVEMRPANAAAYDLADHAEVQKQLEL